MHLFPLHFLHSNQHSVEIWHLWSQERNVMHLFLILTQCLRRLFLLPLYCSHCHQGTLNNAGIFKIYDSDEFSANWYCSVILTSWILSDCAFFPCQTGVDPCAILAARRKAQKKHAREIKKANKVKKKAVLKLVNSSVNIYLYFLMMLSGITVLVYTRYWCYSGRKAWNTSTEKCGQTAKE